MVRSDLDWTLSNGSRFDLETYGNQAGTAYAKIAFTNILYNVNLPSSENDLPGRIKGQIT